MVFRDNIVYKNDNTISKNHLIFISNIPFDTSSIFGIILLILLKIIHETTLKSGIDERKCVCYYKNNEIF